MGDLATASLVVAVCAEGIQVALTEGDVQARALGVAAVALIAFVVGLRYGRRLYRRERIRSVGWLPETMTWHVDADGAQHAIVRQNSGDVVSVAVPPHVAAEDRLTYVLVRLNEGRS
jgi:hypothetical protein